MRINQRTLDANLRAARVERLAMALWAAHQWGPRIAWSTIEKNWTSWHQKPWLNQARDVFKLLDKAAQRHGQDRGKP